MSSWRELGNKERARQEKAKSEACMKVEPPTREKLLGDYRWARPVFWCLKYIVFHESGLEDLQDAVGSSYQAELSREKQAYLNDMGFTLLHRVAICGAPKEEVIALLNDPKVASTIDAKTRSGHTALGFAACAGHTELVNILLDKGALVTKDENAKESELTAAICTNQLEIARILIDHGSLVNVLCEGWSPLHLACYLKLPSFIKLLVENGADVDLIAEARYTPINMLHMNSNDGFLSYRRDNVVELNEQVYRSLVELLKAPNLDVNFCREPGHGNPPAVSWAFTYFLPKVLLTLINNGAKTDLLFEPAYGAIFAFLFPLRGEMDTLHRVSVLITIQNLLSVWCKNMDTSMITGPPPETCALAKKQYLSCLYLLVNHGIEPSRPPGSDKANLAASILLNQLREENVDAPEAVEFLEDICNTVQTLQSLCRPVVRKYLGHPLAKKIRPMYQISRCMKEYLLFEDTDFDDMEELGYNFQTAL